MDRGKKKLLAFICLAFICLAFICLMLYTQPPALLQLSRRFKAIEISASNTAFADDLGLLSNSVSGWQKLLDIVDQFFVWTDCMQAAPQKCQSTAAK